MADASKRAGKRAEKQPRKYQSPVREEQAQRTKARIVEAAAELFTAHGYVATTIRQIAEAAQVSADTVYTVFGSKPRLLTAVIDARLAPASEVDSVLETPGAHAVRDAADQHTQLALFAEDMARISTRVRPVFEILRVAAGTDPELKAVYAEMEGYRARNMRQAAEWVAARGPLRLSVEEAADTMWVVASPEVGRLLCDVRGWSADQHAQWMADTLVQVLLPARPATRRRT